MTQSNHAVPTTAEANDWLIRQLCESLGCEHDIDALISEVEILQGVHARYQAAMTDIASLTAMVDERDRLLGAANAELERVRPVLKIYADPKTWVRGYHWDGRQHNCLVVYRGAGNGYALAQSVIDALASPAAEPAPDILAGAYIVNRADGVDGHYCLARYNERGRFVEYYNNGKWCSAGQVFKARTAPAAQPEQEKDQ